MKLNRKTKGSAIAFGAMLAFVLVALGLGFLAFSMYMGGQNETRNAVDSGALNLGRQIIDDTSKIGFKLNVADEDERFFADVTTDTLDRKHFPDANVNLRRINRIWAEALLVGLNADAEGNGTMINHATTLCDTARKLSDKLCDNLTKPSNLHQFFMDFASKNNVRMLGLGAGVSVVPNNNWKFSKIGVDHEANIAINGSPGKFFLPGKDSFPASSYTKCLRENVPQSAANLNFLRGYHGYSVGPNLYWFVPFPYEEKPHLVSDSQFTGPTTVGGTVWEKPIPNGYEVEGKGEKAGSIGETAVARVLTNPNQTFAMSIPNAYIHIKVEPMKAHYQFIEEVFPVESPQTVSYTTVPEEKIGPSMAPGGVLCTMVTSIGVILGLEVAGADLERFVYGQVDDGGADVDRVLVQRINEMVTVPGVTLTKNDLHNAMRTKESAAALAAEQYDFYIYSPDGKTIKCDPEALLPVNAPWLVAQLALSGSNDPDGQSNEDSIDSGTVPMMQGMDMPIIEPNPACSPIPWPVSTQFEVYKKEVYWQAGSGYNKNLGVLRVKHWTDVWVIGACNPL